MKKIHQALLLGVDPAPLLLNPSRFAPRAARWAPAAIETNNSKKKKLEAEKGYERRESITQRSSEPKVARRVEGHGMMEEWAFRRKNG